MRVERLRVYDGEFAFSFDEEAVLHIVEALQSSDEPCVPWLQIAAGLLEALP